VPDRAKGERLIVFHLPTSQQPRDIVKKLAERGLPNLWIPSADSFAAIDELPILGSGKLDLRALGTMAKERFAEGASS
jgi:acyl-[acyl-carrier-protein]-phospholipid O-acyltransferase/long-chain-fatty-acid--[acyl-carrier-protein] ligase